MGAAGRYGNGDVQWMTAASGIIHEEFHADDFTVNGGTLEMVQLWVNLPQKDKMSKAGYQGITSDDIPVVELANGAGKARIIAGDFAGVNGPARTFSPINLWDVKLNRDAEVTLDLPEGHTALIAVLTGHVTVGDTGAGEAEIIRFAREGSDVTLRADGNSQLLVLTGEPLNEPVFGYGPFVMTSEAEIRQAVIDFNSGRFGQVGA